MNLSFCDVGRMEQVSRKWQAYAKTYWSIQTEIRLSDFTIFGREDFMSFKTQHQYENTLICLFEQKFEPVNVRKLDITGLGVHLISDHNLYHLALEFLNRCTRVFDLSIDFKISRNYLHGVETMLEKYFSSSSSSQLKSLLLKGSEIKDDCIKLVLDKCKTLENLLLEDTRIIGECFKNMQLNTNLKRVKIKSLLDPDENSLIALINKCPGLTHLDIDVLNTDLYMLLPYIVQKLANIEQLSVPFNEVSKKVIEQMSSLENLQKLILSDEIVDSKTIALILNKCKSLKHFVLNDFRGKNYSFKSNIFTLMPINAPLEILEINGYEGESRIDDLAFSGFDRVAGTLKQAKLVKINKVTSNGVAVLMGKCRNLQCLDLFNMKNVNESVLEKAFELKRAIRIKFYNTNVDFEKFLRDKSGYSRINVLEKAEDVVLREITRVKLEDLTFEFTNCDCKLYLYLLLNFKKF